MTKFLLDENVDVRLKDYLVELGFDTTAISKDYPHALSDKEVLKISNKESRILATNDRDYGELIFSQKLKHSGVIYFRLKSVLLNTLIARFEYVLEHHNDDLQKYLVVTDYDVIVRDE